MTDLLKFYSKPKLRHPTMVVSWQADAGQLGPGVADYLTKELEGEIFCEIEPSDFFALNGVNIENNLAVFPESNFYAFPEHNLIVFHSAIPRFEWHKFFNLILDVAQEYYKTKEIFTVGGMVSLGLHTNPREFWATFSNPKIKRSLAAYHLSRETDFETPPGGRPTLNAFLLWAAKQRGLNGANLWVPVPFYLVGQTDPRAQKTILEFLDNRILLALDYKNLDISQQHQDELIDS
ncbi:MAG: PAC2 family protein, partial [Dehalococcoidales bacterium]|nr:PAC2 family protein [Dehalococcoidales bacterium]